MSVGKKLLEVQKLIVEQKHSQAWDACQKLLERHPENVKVLLQYADLCYQKQLYMPAIENYQRAFFLGADRSLVAENYLNALVNVGRLSEAELEAKMLLQKKPNDTFWLNALGVVLKRQGKLKEAEAVLLKAVSGVEKAGNKLYQYNLGLVYIQQHDMSKAIEQFSEVVKSNPNLAHGHRLLSYCYRSLGDFDKVFSHLKTAQLLEPKNVKNYIDMVYANFVIKEYEKAWQVVLEAKAIFGDTVDLLILEGECLYFFGRREDALHAFEKASLIDPSDERPLRKLAYMWMGFDREKANRYFYQALVLKPADPDIAADFVDSLSRSIYGNELQHMENAYQLAIKIVDNNNFLVPFAMRIYGILAQVVDFDRADKLGSRFELMEYTIKRRQVSFLHLQLSQVKTLEDRYQILQYHRLWGEKIEEIVQKNPVKLHPPQPRKKIRIGIMSSDLRNHPVAYFVLPIFQYYDRDRFEIYCYSYNTLEEDEAQLYIKKKVDVFRLEQKISERDAAQLIANDQLDILFDLGGATDMNKVEVLAYRPAPIQVSWLGYPHSLGLKTIDYILVDPYLNPPDPSLIVEKPFVMPETWLTMSPEGFKEESINPILPQTRKGFVTFGTMNNSFKYNRKLFEVWAKVLQAVPDSHFLFARPEGNMPSFRANICKEFNKQGITSDRIEFIGVRATHRQHYNAMDISLDTFPQTGGTTTCESLWMGVPVITLVGPAFFERLSYSNLMNLGLSELCAFSEDEYIQKAVALAENQALCQDLRINLRDRIRQSPLGQTKHFVENWQNLIEKVVKKELVL